MQAKFLYTGALIGFLLLGAFPASAQRQPSAAEREGRFFIKKIVILGNKKTHASVIRREMKVRENQHATVRELEMDRLRIESLGLFNRVEMQLRPLDREGREYELEITVTEQWYLFPFPILFFNDREIRLKKLSYGLGMVHTNFRGRAELLQFAGWLGYNPSANLMYANPWIFGKKQYFIRLQMQISRVVNKSYQVRDQEVKENTFLLGATLGKQLTLHTSVSVGLSFRRIRLQPASLGRTLDPSGLDRNLQLQLTYVRDHRDLMWYPLQGSFIRLFYLKAGWPGARYIDYGRASVDVRRYIPLGGKTALAFRAAGDWSHGRIPNYDRLFFGYRHRLRGYFDLRVEGERRLMFGAGFRFPIVPVRYFQLSEEMGQYGKNLRFGVNGEFFFDAGSMWLQNRADRPQPPPETGPFGSQTRPRRWLYGYGFGLDVQLPYVNVMRFEIARNDHGDSEMIVDIGVAF